MKRFTAIVLMCFVLGCGKATTQAPALESEPSDLVEAKEKMIDAAYVEAERFRNELNPTFDINSTDVGGSINAAAMNLMLTITAIEQEYAPDMPEGEMLDSIDWIVDTVPQLYEQYARAMEPTSALSNAVFVCLKGTCVSRHEKLEAFVNGD